MSLLDSIPGIVSGALSATFRDHTLSRDESGAYDPDTGAVTGAVAATYGYKGLVEEWSRYHLVNGLVPAGAVKIIVLASTLSTVPRPGDTILDENSVRYRIGDGPRAVERDPAGATYTLVALKA